MMIIAAVLVALSVMGTSAQTDITPQATCPIPSFTARSLATVEFKVYDFYNDGDNQVSLREAVDGPEEWRLIDLKNHVAYNFNENDGCVKQDLQGGSAVTADEIRAAAQFQYRVTAPNVDNNAETIQYSAWSYSSGNITLNGLVNPDCVSVITAVTVDGALRQSNLLSNINVVNPDLAQLRARQGVAASVLCN